MPPQVTKKRGVVSGCRVLGCWLSSAGMQSLGKMGGLLGLASEKMERQLCLAGPGLAGLSAHSQCRQKGILSKQAHEQALKWLCWYFFLGPRLKLCGVRGFTEGLKEARGSALWLTEVGGAR